MQLVMFMPWIIETSGAIEGVHDGIDGPVFEYRSNGHRSRKKSKGISDVFDMTMTD